MENNLKRNNHPNNRKRMEKLIDLDNKRDMSTIREENRYW